MTFIKQFEDTLEHCTRSFSFKGVGQQNVGTKPSNHFTDLRYKQCVRPIFEYWIVSAITVSDTVINKLQRVQKSFIRLALRLPKYVWVRLLNETSGLPYIKERLISVGQNKFARMHVTPLIKHTINSVRTNMAWDKSHRPLTTLKTED